MPETLSTSAQKVQDTLRSLGVPCEVVELPDSTCTAAEATQAIGCQVAQIVKSLIFRGRRTGNPILILVSGVNHVKQKKMAVYVGEPIGKADADFVRQRTGFAIGGVPPAGHLEPLSALVDEDLLHHEEVWAAAGTPHAVFRLSPADLIRITQGQVIPVK